MQASFSSIGKRLRVDSVSPELFQNAAPMPEFDSRPVLWRNVSSLMKKKYGKEHISRLSREAGIGLATISRIKGVGTSVGTDVIDSIASALGAEPWQLMNPSFDAEGSSSSTSYSPLAADLAEQLDGIAEQAKKEKAYALATQVIGLADTSQAAEPAPAQRPKQRQTSGQ